MADKSNSTGFEPDVWLLIFRKKSDSRLVNWLSFGRFKHVLAVGWVPAQKVWLVYEVFFGCTSISVLPDDDATGHRLQAMQENSVTLAVVPRGERRCWFRLGFWCVPAIAHLVGMPCALRPDALYRHCRRYKAEIVNYGCS